MRIGMLLDKPFPPDPRVANEARSLVEGGHEVHLLAVTLDPDQPVRESWQGVEIHRILMSKFRYKKLSALALVLPLYFRSFAGPLDRMIVENEIDAIHAHDLPMLSIALEVGNHRRIPVVADLHENYPAAVATYDYANRFPGNLLISPASWRRFEQAHLPRADRIIVVVEEAAERLIAAGIAKEKIEVVSNTVHVDDFEGFPRDTGLEEELGSKFTLAYLGGFDRHRGLESVLEAVRVLAPEDPALQLLLVGDGATRTSLQGRAEEWGLTDRVRFEGWQPFERFRSYVGGSSVCLIPHVKSDHTDTTIPHKLFHYMLLERPVISSDCLPLARILNETEAGVVYRSNDVEGLVERIRSLKSEELRRRLGENGRKAVADRYNWGLSSRTLLDLYAGIEQPLPAKTASRLGANEAHL